MGGPAISVATPVFYYSDKTLQPQQTNLDTNEIFAFVENVQLTNLIGIVATIALWYHTVFGIQNIEVQISLHPHLLFRMGSVDEDNNVMTKVQSSNPAMDSRQHYLILRNTVT
ncbi:hypothetical protein OUZ56_009575 [Daphnia magna]|uniref:Uncharacterized protein n=1 Tax=Daphnia magna TaxID=35525 RepID=A0ABR0AGK2_9CRUS|nr:hypothetical protein OUZ56_009575 [Daphnia magna]